MKKKKIIYKNFIQKQFFSSRNVLSANNKFTNIFNDIFSNLDTDKSFLSSLSHEFKLSFRIKDLDKFKKFNKVVIIGMGGSILGAEAIYFFLKKKIKKEFLFLDNINEHKLKKIKKTNKFKKTLFILISKSGNTVETLSNIRALSIIKKGSKNVIVISEKRENTLYSLAKKFKLFHIEHKNYIGGRYSIFSESGIVPAYLMGVNIDKFRKNLLIHFNNQNKKYLKNISTKLAGVLQKRKLNSLIFFNYIPELKKFLYWNQQLIAESLGKEGKGFLPIISPAPKDHHSMLQLYLDGPRDKLFYVFSLETNKKEKINSKIFGKKLNFLNNKSLNQIKKAQKNAFLKTLKKKRIPFREFKIKDLSEESLGELFSYFMLETVIVGKLINIDPFNQPAVEMVKVNTKNILS